MSKTVIKPCDCKHEFQDQTYGKGMRVHNLTKGTGSQSGSRCTVCAKTK